MHYIISQVWYYVECYWLCNLLAVNLHCFVCNRDYVGQRIFKTLITYLLSCQHIMIEIVGILYALVLKKSYAFSAYHRVLNNEISAAIDCVQRTDYEREILRS